MSVYINAGEMDQRITLQQRASESKDGQGQANAAWVSVFTDIAARADTRPGQDAFAAGMEHPTQPVTFRIRFRLGVHSRMRVLWRGRVYELVGQPINVRGANVALDLQCVAGVKDGR